MADLGIGETATAALLTRCWFDEDKCAAGLARPITTIDADFDPRVMFGGQHA